jgi:LysM repeat protein
MVRTRGRLLWALLLSVSLLTLCLYTVGFAAEMPQEAPQAEADGQEYEVKAGDWLSKISQQFLGSAAAYPLIVEATNAKAESDPRFMRITDPNVIEVGQLLWIPNSPARPSTTVTPTVAPTAASSPVTDTVRAEEAITLGVRFAAPDDGAAVPPRFDVEMAAHGLTVEPAGEINEGAGHFHILVDTDFVAADELVPFDDRHLHYGQGQLTTTLELTPGVHGLRLQFANGAHIALAGAQYRDEITVTVSGERSALPSVRFVAPEDGAVTPPRFDVEMAAEGIVVEPAGEIHEGAGHFHIMVDSDFVAPGELVPFDDQHLHYGQGQLTTTLELAPGVHTLRLQLANGAHIALAGAQYRDTITVTVAGD